ncbi:MAG: hypothetical protein NWF03_01275 [Candidatus Bathyarchaeota archaeon]|nr:hypothetical protein [Candidatus Bathyarchaeota archaeon]
MVKQILPCAGKNCKGKMSLVENAGNLLYYRCLEKFDEHTFRYDIDQKRWEQIVFSAKRIFNYTENPLEQTPKNAQSSQEPEEMLVNSVQES